MSEMRPFKAGGMDLHLYILKSLRKEEKTDTKLRFFL